MRTTILTAAAAVLLLAGCGDDGTDAAAATSSSSSSATTTTAAAEPEDVAGKSNCVAAALAYAPIESGLDGSVDLAGAVGFFTAPDIDPATSEAGKAAAVAIAEANYAMSLANVDVLTRKPIDTAELRRLVDEMHAACAQV